MPEGACPDLLILPLYAAMPLELQVCCHAQCPLEPVSGASVPTGQWSCTQLLLAFIRLCEPWLHIVPCSSHFGSPAWGVCHQRSRSDLSTHNIFRLSIFHIFFSRQRDRLLMADICFAVSRPGCSPRRRRGAEG